MRSWRTVLAVVIGGALGGAILLHRGEIVSALNTVTDLSGPWAATLGFVTVLTVVIAGWSTALLHPGLSLRRSITLHQATIAANNTVVASGPASLALRISMLRSWRMRDSTIATCVVVSNVVSSFRVWIMALVVAFIGMSGSATELVDTWVFATVTLIGVTVIAISAGWWWLVVRHDRLAAWCASQVQRLVDGGRRRWRRLPEIDLAIAVERFRHEVAGILRARSRWIMAALVADMALVLATPLVVARALGIDASMVTNSELVVAFGLVRLAAALSPIPGGIGISEIGATLALERLGAPPDAVVATVIVHRGITFLVPLLVGGGCLAWWHRGTRRDRVLVTSCAPVTVDAEPGSLEAISGIGHAR